MEPQKVIYLCPACGACPSVELFEDKVRIGEKGNRVVLSKDEWNGLVEKIKRGELGKV